MQIMMPKPHRSFVEFQYQVGPYSDTFEKEINDRSQYIVEDDGEINGYRFFDITVRYQGDNTFKEVAENISNWVYFGRRCSCADVLKTYGNTPATRIMINKMINDGCVGFCISRSGRLIPLYEGDKVYGESTKEKEGSK